VLSSATNFLSFKASGQALLPKQLPTQLVVKHDNSPPFSAEIEDVWGYTATSPYAFIVWYLIMCRYSFCFSLLSLISKTYQEHDLFVRLC
jgi:hypothetical protein